SLPLRGTSNGLDPLELGQSVGFAEIEDLADGAVIQCRQLNRPGDVLDVSPSAPPGCFVGVEPEGRGCGPEMLQVGGHSLMWISRTVHHRKSQDCDRRTGTVLSRPLDH